MRKNELKINLLSYIIYTQQRYIICRVMQSQPRVKEMGNMIFKIKYKISIYMLIYCISVISNPWLYIML